MEKRIMPRKEGDKNFSNYVGIQAFNSDEPTHQVNNTRWYLKWENGKPAFFLQAEKVFRQMPFETFKGTATHKAKQVEFSGFAEQVKDYFKLTMEDIEKCLSKH